MTRIFNDLISKRTVTSVVVIALVIGLLLALKRLSSRWFERNQDHFKGKKETYFKLFFNILSYIIIWVAVLLILENYGVNISSMVAGLGIASAIAGLALQDLLKDMIMGVNIISDDFFAVGDVVKYGNLEGRVTAFTVKTTKIRDINTGDEITICNRNISEISRVSDWLDLLIPASYEEDQISIRSLLEECCGEIKKWNGIHACRLLGLNELGDSSLYYRIRIFCNPERKPEIRRKSLEFIYDKFIETGHSIPYPQIDVHCNERKKISAPLK